MRLQTVSARNMQIAVAGKVLSEMTRESIQYAGVVVKGTSNDTIADSDGRDEATVEKSLRTSTSLSSVGPFLAQPSLYGEHGMV